MTIPRADARRKLIAKLKRQGFDKETFATKAEVDAFMNGLEAGIDHYRCSASDTHTLPPTSRTKEWTVYFKVEYFEDEDY